MKELFTFILFIFFLGVMFETHPLERLNHYLDARQRIQDLEMKAKEKRLKEELSK